MTQEKPKRAASRYPYSVQAQSVHEGTVVPCQLMDISTSGIQIATDQKMDINTEISLMWEDSELGEVEGHFYVIRQFQNEQGKALHYGLRYYQLDADSKQKVLSILNRLKNVKTKEVEKISLNSIYEVMDQGKPFFIKTIKDPSSVHLFFSDPIKNFKPYEKEVFLGESNPFKDVIAEYVVCAFYCTLLKNVVGFSLKKPKRIPDLLNRAIKLLQTIEELSPKEDAAFAYIQKLPNVDELRVQYNESTNRVFYASQAMMEKIIKGLENFPLLPELKSKLEVIAKQYDHTIELTNPNLQLEDIHTVSKHPPKQEPKKQDPDSPFYIPDVSSKNTGKKIFLALMILGIAIAQGVAVFSKTSNTKEFSESLKLPIPIVKVEKEGSQLIVYCKEEDWVKLDEAKTVEIRERVKLFIEKDKWIKTAIIRTGTANMKMLITSLE